MGGPIGAVAMDADKNAWVSVVMPLIAEHDEPETGRKRGDYLWDRFSIDDFPSVERGEISSRSFAALYQQRPAAAEGNLFKAAWFEHRYDALPSDAPHPDIYDPTKIIRPKKNVIIQAVDSSLGLSDGADFTVIATILFNGVDYFILNIRRERANFAGLQRMIVEEFQTYTPRVVYIEQVAAHSGTALVQELKRVTSLPVIGVPPKGSKVARAELTTGLRESGRVKLPKRASWLDAFIDEMLTFPNGKHDDQTDAVVLGISQINTVPTATPWSFTRVSSLSNYRGAASFNR